MKKATLVVSLPYRSNQIFDRNNSVLNRDDCLAPFFFLKKEFKSRGIDLSTQDIHPIETSDYIIYNDMPKKLPNESDTQKSFLLILESPLVVKNSWIPERLKSFKKVFTWNDDYIDDQQFIKVNYSYDFESQGMIKTQAKNKLLCMISANKSSAQENELYSERERTVRWYETYHPQDFDLYGMGWDKIRLSGIFRVLKKVPFLWKSIPFNRYPSYKGAVSSKKAVISNYKFALCYENIHSLNGYITEKIFDCFFSGTVPIYLGAKNITDYIPSNCFIDRRDFSDLKHLHQFISSMTNEAFQDYIKNIECFLHKQKNGAFSCSHFAKMVVDQVSMEEE